MFRICAYYIQHCSGNGTRSTRVQHVPTNSLPSIMSLPGPRKSKCVVVKEIAKKIYNRLFPHSSSSSQKPDVSSSRLESLTHVPSTTVLPSHTLHAPEGGFLNPSASVQDMGKYIDRKAGLLSELKLASSRSREDPF